MRVAIFNVLGAGHVNPTLPIVRALTGRGDDVRYFTYAPRRKDVEAVGATFHAYGDDDFSVARFHPKGAFPTQLLPAAGLLPQLVDEVGALAPDLVIADSMAPWGFALAAVLEKPVVGSVSTFALTSSTIATMGAPTPDEVNQEARETIRSRWGIELSLSEFPFAHAARNLVYTSRSFNPPLPSGDDRFEFLGPMLGRPAPAADACVDWFAEGGATRIYLSMGTVVGKAHGLGASFYAPFFEAFGGDDALRVVVSVGDAVDPAALMPPPNFRLRVSVPQVDLLRHTDVFVTHGGMNSASEALVLGVPLVVIPFMADQPLVASRVAACGAGVMLDPAALDARTIRGAVDRVKREPSYAAAARQVGDDLRAGGGVARALQIIDAAAGR